MNYQLKLDHGEYFVQMIHLRFVKVASKEPGKIELHLTLNMVVI